MKHKAPLSLADRKAAAIEAVAQYGSRRQACLAAGVNRRTLAEWEREDDVFFEDLQNAALDYADMISETVVRRGVEGEDTPALYKGQPIPKLNPVTGEPELDDDFNPVYVMIKVKSDPLLLAAAKAYKPEFRDKGEMTLLGPGGGPVKEPDININIIKAPNANVPLPPPVRPVIEAEAISEE